ncbi:hypothetical protein [Trinickia diaoshuihuensis]|uniref:hypothetical protein n=1 Tax=Trinickia diaoshuihuensis TaxID=2292265 RepID=UPI0013C3366E|nr:hypothetical protein [Trinickia diaoshuihuensis]
MQHTVIAFFDTYPQAEAARDALLAAGIAPADVTLKAKCEPTYVTDATSAYEPAPAANEGLLASIERFFESLFETGPREREREHYAEAVRRGAVMVCVEAATDELAQLTRTTLEPMGPLDVEERAATWSPPIDDAARSHSPLEELGLRPSVPAATASHGAVYTYARDGAGTPARVPTPGGRSETEAAATAVAAGSAPGMGAVFTAGHGTPATAPATSPLPRPNAMPDEYLQDEENFRGDGEGAERR